MSRGLRKVWLRAPRIVTGAKGKKGGPVIEQRVELVLVPKDSA